MVGALRSGKRLAQSAGTSAPWATSMSMSLAWFMVITSASSPSATLRACLLDPPCDWFSDSVWPVCANEGGHSARARSVRDGFCLRLRLPPVGGASRAACTTSRVSGEAKARMNS